jgi:hypothetical protein
MAPPVRGIGRDEASHVADNEQFARICIKDSLWINPGVRTGNDRRGRLLSSSGELHKKLSIRWPDRGTKAAIADDERVS